MNGFSATPVSSRDSRSLKREVTPVMKQRSRSLSRYTDSEIKGAQSWSKAKKKESRKKRLQILQQLLSLDESYVNRLKIIAVDFYGVIECFMEKSGGSLTDTDIKKIFQKIQSIYKLSQNVLKDLKMCIDKWGDEENVGGVFFQLAQLYSLHLIDLEESLKALAECAQRNEGFKAVLNDFECTALSSGLRVAQYMMEPIQRIPRHCLLLTEYLDHLPPFASDRDEIEDSLGIISKAADKYSDKIKELEISSEILNIQQCLLECNETLLQPSRTFIKKGALLKMTRTNRLHPRMFFLFSDILLHTYPAVNGMYKFKDKMPLHEMQVQDSAVSADPKSFEVHCTSRSLLLIAQSDLEKQEWMEALSTAIIDAISKTRNLRRKAKVLRSEYKDGFGCMAPVMVPDKSVSMCQVCGDEFTVIFRRHHCRACGKVVCGKCSQKRVFLHYVQKRERVCIECYEEYLQSLRNAVAGSLGALDAKHLYQAPSAKYSGVLDLKAHDQHTVEAGYVLSQKGKKYVRAWYQVRQNCALYKFRAHEDIKAYHSIPLPGYNVQSDPSNHLIHLVHPSRKKKLGDSFKVENDKAYARWLYVLEKVVHMDVPIALEDDKGETECYNDSSTTCFSSDSSPCSDIDDSFSDVSTTVEDVPEHGENQQQVLESPYVSETQYHLPELDIKRDYKVVARNSVCLIYLPNDCAQQVCVMTISDLMLHPILKANEVLITPVVCVSPDEMISSEKPAIIELLNTGEFANMDITQKIKHTLVPIYSNASPVQWKKVELQDCIVYGDRVTFKTNHFSYFAVVAQHPISSVSAVVKPGPNHENKSVELTIPELPGFKVEIPPASVQCATNITATVCHSDPDSELHDCDCEFQSPASAFVILEPHNTQFLNKVPITVPIPGYAKITEEHPDIKLQLWYASHEDSEQIRIKWEHIEEADIDISCDSDGNYLATTYTSHFSIFRYLWNIVIDWRLNYFAERIRGRCQVFMTREVKLGSCVTFGITVLLYPFRDPYDKLDQYEYILLDGCVPIEYLAGDKRCCIKLDSSLPLDSDSCNPEQNKRLSKDYEMRVDFVIRLQAGDKLELPEGMVLGKLHIDEHVQQHEFLLIKTCTLRESCPSPPSESKQSSENLIIIAAQQLCDSLKRVDDDFMTTAVRRMSNEMKNMAKHMRGTFVTEAEDSKDTLITSACCIAEESRKVEKMARELASACTEEGLQKAMLDVADQLPVVTKQLMIRTTHIRKGQYDTEATKEAVDLLTHNAINLASKTGEVLHYIEIVSATGKVLPSNTDMLSNVNPSWANLTLIKYLKNKDPKQAQIGHFRLKSRILHKWKDIGNLVISRQLLEVWSKRMDDKECCHAMLCQWLDNPPDKYPATWKGLYDLLNDSELGQVAADLQFALENAII